MARKITDKPNALPVSGIYPYGDIKDNSGSGDGVPVNRVVYADFHQFFARIADLAGIVLNSLPDNAVNGWQFVTALQTLIANAVSSEASIRSAADTNLTNTKVAKAGDTMSGILGMGGNVISGLGSPVNPTDATTKNYVDVTDNALQTNINSEASTRSSADTTLQNNINTEASTRGSADTSLQANISDIVSNPTNANTLSTLGRGGIRILASTASNLPVASSTTLIIEALETNAVNPFTYQIAIILSGASNGAIYSRHYDIPGGTFTAWVLINNP